MKIAVDVLAILLPYMALVFCAGLLVYYRLHRKFSKERVSGWRALIDHNIVELLIAAMYTALVAPDWAGMLTGVFT